MKNDAPMILISGCPRTGTTLMANWLSSVLAPPWLAVRESGISLVAHQCFHVAEYNVRDHNFSYKLNECGESRSQLAGAIRAMANSLYASLSWSPGQPILDKQPYTLPDGCSYFRHLIEVFPAIKIIYMVREPHAVMSSMMARQWGRGPFPRLPYSSPFTYAMSDFENTFGDIYPDHPDEPGIATGPRKWSAKKALISYRNALEGYLSAEIEDRCLVVDYDSLPQLPWHDAISNFIGEEVSVRCPFERRLPSNSNTYAEQDHDGIGSDIGNLYSLVKNQSIEGFARWSALSR